VDRKKEDQMAQSSSPTRSRRALIVEDETMIALNLEADMRELGFDTCDLAANGQQARSQAMSNQPDVVLMDVNLEGGREGIEAARSLREECDVPVVFVTGHTDRDTVERIHKVVPGAPVLPKPVWSDRLADAVKAVMSFRMW
jgi:DNA-binding response OmpR family regulator